MTGQASATEPEKRRAMTWAMRFKRVFKIDGEAAIAAYNEKSPAVARAMGPSSSSTMAGMHLMKLVAMGGLEPPTSAL